MGKVIPLRQYRRRPGRDEIGGPPRAFANALARLAVGHAPGTRPTKPGPNSPGAPAEADGIRTWLAALEGLDARRAEELQIGAGRLRVASSALAETLSHLRRMRDLAGGSRSGTEADGIAALAEEVTRVSENADYAGDTLLAGGPGAPDASAEALGVARLDPAAPDALARIDAALSAVTRTRSDLAQLEERFESAMQEISVARQNVAAACIDPSDVGDALERAEEVRASVLGNVECAARSVDVAPAVVLKLIR